VKAPLSESPLRPLVRALGERGGGGSTNEGQSGVRRRRETGERERGESTVRDSGVSGVDGVSQNCSTHRSSL